MLFHFRMRLCLLVGMEGFDLLKFRLLRQTPADSGRLRQRYTEHAMLALRLLALRLEYTRVQMESVLLR